jgi:cardiolipin synthase
MLKATMFTFPLLLTLARFVLVVPIVLALAQSAWLTALGLIALAGLTDFLDGYLARAWGQESFLGACLDPVADKVLIVAVYATLLLHGAAGFTTPLWFLVLLVMRELVILGGALILGLMRHDLAIRPTLLGKITTTVHLVFMSLLFLAAACDCSWGWLICPLFWLAVSCVLVSLVQYVFVGIRGVICSKK